MDEIFPAPNPLQSTPVTVAIIGGGPGGLMAAHLLKKRAGFPCAITLFEACGRLGGKIVTSHFKSAPGIRYESGAAEFYDYSQLGPDPLRELIAELGLTTTPMQAGGAVFRGNVIRSLDDLRKHEGETTWKAIKQFEQMARAQISSAEYYESDWQEDNNEAIGRMSFHELIASVPDEAARDYIRTMVHSDLACEPHQTNANYGLQNYLMDEPDYMQLYSIDGGNERLIEELAKRCCAEVRMREPVLRVERDARGGYLVTSRQGRALKAATFDYVIVALPNDALPFITWGGDRLREAMDKHHQFYDHPAHYLRVTALFDRPFWRDHIQGSFFMSEVFGGCCLYDESSRFACEGKGVLAWLIAGEAALRFGNMDDESLINHAVRSLPGLLGAEGAQLLEGRVQRWAGSVNGLPAGFPARDPDSRHQPEPLEHPGLFVMGDYLFDSTINGVLDSADTVVEWIIEEETEEPAPIAAQILETTLTS